MLHKSGIYFLWAYPFSVYWWNLSYYENPQPIDYVFYWSGFLAFALENCGLGQESAIAGGARETTPDSQHTARVQKYLGATVIIAFGLFVAATGLQWQEPGYGFPDSAEVVCGSGAVVAVLAFRTLSITLHHWTRRRAGNEGQGLTQGDIKNATPRPRPYELLDRCEVSLDFRPAASFHIYFETVCRCWL